MSFSLGSEHQQKLDEMVSRLQPMSFSLGSEPLFSNPYLIWHKFLGNSSDLHNRKQTNAICDYTEAKDINQAVENKRPPNSDGRSCTCIDLPFGIATHKMYINE